MLFDAIAIVIVLISIMVAIFRGLIREVLTLFGMFGGALAAFIGGPLVIPTMNGLLGVEEGTEPEVFMGIIPYDILAVVLAYLSVFLVFLILLSILSHFLSSAVKNLGLGAVDRSLGALFGIARGLLVLGLLYLPVYFVVEKENVEQWGWVSGSQTHGYVVQISEIIIGYIPYIDTQDEGEVDGDDLTDIGKKVMDMDLLKNEGEQDGNELDEPPPISEPNMDGYTEEFRDGMDKLMEQVQPPSPSYNE